MSLNTNLEFVNKLEMDKCYNVTGMHIMGRQYAICRIHNNEFVVWLKSKMCVVEGKC